MSKHWMVTSQKYIGHKGGRVTESVDEGVPSVQPGESLKMNTNTNIYAVLIDVVTLWLSRKSG